MWLVSKGVNCSKKDNFRSRIRSPISRPLEQSASGGGVQNRNVCEKSFQRSFPSELWLDWWLRNDDSQKWGFSSVQCDIQWISLKLGTLAWVFLHGPVHVSEISSKSLGNGRWSARPFQKDLKAKIFADFLNVRGPPYVQNPHGGQ